jgi:hypothetical protein
MIRSTVAALSGSIGMYLVLSIWVLLGQPNTADAQQFNCCTSFACWELAQNVAGIVTGVGSYQMHSIRTAWLGQATKCKSNNSPCDCPNNGSTMYGLSSPKAICGNGMTGNQGDSASGTKMGSGQMASPCKTCTCVS